MHVSPLDHNPLTTLEYVQLSRNDVVPGDTLDAVIGWRDFQGRPGRKVVPIAVPRDWQGRTLSVVVTNGSTLDQLTGRSASVAIAQLRGFDAYLDFVRQSRPPDGLMVAVVEGTQMFIDQTSGTP